MEVYNRHNAQTGRVERIEVRDIIAPHGSAAPFDFNLAGLGGAFGGHAPSGHSGAGLFGSGTGLFGGIKNLLPGIGGELGGLLKNFGLNISLGDLETEDIILMLILYLMYRESGDIELLIALGAMLFL
jgi:hypothetical protein